MQGSLGEWSEDSPGIGPYSGSAGGHTTGNIASTTALQSVAVSEERRDPPPLIRYDSDSESSQPEGSTMVDEQFEPSEWETDSHASPRHSDRIGCVQHRLGSLLQGHKDERSVVQGRSHSPYQLQRDVGSISCTTVVCEGYTRSPCQTPDRQHDDGVLYQPYGGHTLSPVNEHDITDLVMVPGQEAAFDSGASTWPLESGGGSGVQNAGRQFGVEVKSSGLQSLDGTARSMHSGSVRISADSSIRDVHELEAGSRSSGNGCVVTTVDVSERIRISPFLSHRSMPDQGTPGEGIEVSAHCTNVANTAMVSCTSVDGGQGTSDDSTNSRSVAEPQRRGSSSNN